MKLMNEIAKHYRSERLYRLDTLLYTVYKNLSRKLSDAFFGCVALFDSNSIQIH
jgi:hypothetical protein